MYYSSHRVPFYIRTVILNYIAILFLKDFNDFATHSLLKCMFSDYTE